MSREFLRSIRDFELSLALDELERLGASGGKVLEVGAGSGWQAKRLAEAGYAVRAIDIPNSNYAVDQVWPVVTYDGRRIPFATESFDAIFSSNVLEHVADLNNLNKEMWRVLKPDGVAVHFVPSGTWRFWTNLTHYPAKLRALVAGSFAIQPKAVRSGNAQVRQSARKTLGAAMFPRRHGEAGNALSEILLFRRSAWWNRLGSDGWRCFRCSTNRLVYSGNLLFGPFLSIETRSWLSSYLGSSCHLFVLRKTT